MSCLSCVNYPAQKLKAIADRCHELKIDKPRLRWAFDNDSAGKGYTVKWHERSRAEAWSFSLFSGDDLAIPVAVKAGAKVQAFYGDELILTSIAEGRTISRRSIFDWIKAVDDAEKHKINVISILAPKARQTEIPVWAVELLKLWAQPQKPTLPAVLELLPNYLKANVPCLKANNWAKHVIVNLTLNAP